MAKSPRRAAGIGGVMCIEFKCSKKKFCLIATVKYQGLKNVCSNVPGNMGNVWEKIGFIRSAK